MALSFWKKMGAGSVAGWVSDRVKSKSKDFNREDRKEGPQRTQREFDNEDGVCTVLLGWVNVGIASHGFRNRKFVDSGDPRQPHVCSI